MQPLKLTLKGCLLGCLLTLGGLLDSAGTGTLRLIPCLQAQDTAEVVPANGFLPFDGPAKAVLPDQAVTDSTPTELTADEDPVATDNPAMAEAQSKSTATESPVPPSELSDLEQHRALRDSGDDTDTARESSKEPATDNPWGVPLDESFLEEGAELPERSEKPSPEAAKNPPTPTTLGAPDEAKQPLLEGLQPARFNQIQPGVTTRQELEAAWGLPAKVEGERPSAEWHYHQPPFEKVVVSLKSDKVHSILVHLGTPLAPEAVARQLNLQQFTPVPIRDAAQEILGQVYPERGVLFTFASQSKEPLVGQLLLDPLDAQAFTLRAETLADRHYQDRLRDLAIARQLNPSFARSAWLQASMLRELGQTRLALHAAETAHEKEPEQPKILQLLARLYLESDLLAECEQVLDSLSADDAASIEKAQTLLTEGDLVAARTPLDRTRSYELHKQALDLAQKEFESATAPRQREQAVQTLLEAHLAIAEDVALGKWRGKQEATQKWLEQARHLATDITEDPTTRSKRQLHVACAAARLSMTLEGMLDVTPWIKEAYRAGKLLGMQAADPWLKARVQVDLATAFYHAMRASHASGNVRMAVAQGERSQALLSAVLKLQDNEQTATFVSPLDRVTAGQVAYFLGAMQAMDRQDNQLALEHFAQAQAWLRDADAVAGPSILPDLGNAWITMGVSYWRAEERDQALQLTEQGVKLLEKAAARKQISPQLLQIPYSNLASMYRKLGRQKQADQYARLAKLPATAASKKR